jgi:hypothetical protein
MTKNCKIAQIRAKIAAPMITVDDENYGKFLMTKMRKR